jgi:hypothetical protein
LTELLDGILGLNSSIILPQQVNIFQFPPILLADHRLLIERLFGKIVQSMHLQEIGLVGDRAEEGLGLDLLCVFGGVTGCEEEVEMSVEPVLVGLHGQQGLRLVLLVGHHDRRPRQDILAGQLLLSRDLVYVQPIRIALGQIFPSSGALLGLVDQQNTHVVGF